MLYPFFLFGLSMVFRIWERSGLLRGEALLNVFIFLRSGQKNKKIQSTKINLSMWLNCAGLSFLLF